MQNQASETWKSEGPRHWLIMAWQGALRRVLDAMVGTDQTAEAQMSAVCPGLEAWAAWSSPTWCRLLLEGMPGDVISAGCPQATVQRLGRLVSGDQALQDAECRDTLLEVLNQTASLTADAISTRLAKRVNFLAAQIAEGSGELDYAVQIEFSLEGVPQVLGLCPNAGLMEALGGMEGGDEQLPAPAAGTASMARAARSPAAQVAAPRNLDLLMEVELPVCVTFGRTQLALKDVLKLSSGSIVELNRLANEPVEVLINNCVIARGEVVVVEGNYGIRVTEIVSRQERIRSIF